MNAVLAMMAPHEFAMANIIIAGGNMEVASDDLLDWAKPLLDGPEKGHWASLQLEFASELDVFVRFQSGRSVVELNLYETWTSAEITAFLELVPSTDQILILALDKYESQAMSLLDGVANWLMLLESDSCQLIPVNRMLQQLWRMVNSLAG